MSEKTALVLGVTGGIGGEVAKRLKDNGWAVRAFYRDPRKISAREGYEWIRGDAMSKEDVMRAAEGASLIVHAVNPPGYRNWSKLVLPMVDNTIAAAAANGARVVLPGTVYNFGPDALPTLTEDSPQNPVTRKGRIRAEMERRLHHAATRGSAKVLIVRAGDFFGPDAGNNWFSQGLVTPGRQPRSITYPGRAGIGHQWAYLPDVAETMVRLAARDDLDDFAVFHFEGLWDFDGTQMTSAIRRVLGEPAVRIRRMPWALLRLGSPFVPLFRELLEMKYLWDQPVRMTNARLVSTLGGEPRTPLDEAVRATLAGLGCIDHATDAQRPLIAAA